MPRAVFSQSEIASPRSRNQARIFFSATAATRADCFFCFRRRGEQRHWPLLRILRLFRILLPLRLLLRILQMERRHGPPTYTFSHSAARHLLRDCGCALVKQLRPLVVPRLRLKMSIHRSTRRMPTRRSPTRRHPRGCSACSPGWPQLCPSHGSSASPKTGPLSFEDKTT